VETIRVVTWNIHKGVNGLRPRRRLEIHNIGLAIDQFDADIVCLQEVRKHHHGDAQKFARWPALEQADFLAPLGYTPVYQTNAITKHGEHGNALLTRWPVIKHQHEDMSDHRFEQRGLLHVELLIHNQPVHVVVVHLGLINSSRRRQIMQLCTYLQREIPKNVPLLVAGDFNDWGSSCETALKSEQLRTYKTNPITSKRLRTYPSRLPLIQFDYVFARQLDVLNCIVPSGVHWARMSDHLPLIADFKTSN
jgi:endonuclease/exonuclease/phosphatase family metal-dependent hydrolase